MPSASLLSQIDPPQLDTISSTPGILHSILAPASHDQLHWKPSPQRWSIAEVLAHLVNVEKFVLGLRVRRIVEENLPVFEFYDQNEYSAKGAYSGRDARTELDNFTRIRGESIAFLRSVPAAAWERQGRHPEAGLVTVRQLLNLWAFHDLGHIRQIAELFRASAFWHGIGSLQRYYTVNP